MSYSKNQFSFIITKIENSQNIATYEAIKKSKASDELFQQ
jgi:hypothetical protein